MLRQVKATCSVRHSYTSSQNSIYKFRSWGRLGGLGEGLGGVLGGSWRGFGLPQHETPKFLRICTLRPPAYRFWPKNDPCPTRGKT